MSTENRLRDALTREANTIEPRDGWSAIQSRLDETRPRMNRGRILSIAAAVVALLAAVAVIARPDGDDTQPVITEPDATTSVVPTTIRPTTTVVEAVELGPHLGILWSRSFATPEAAANAFARDFLTMPNPSVSPFQQGDNQSGEFVIRPKPNAGPKTTVGVRRFDGQWYVTFANADNLKLNGSTAPSDVTSPLTISGESISFEGHVNVALLRYDTTFQCLVPTDSCGSDPGVYAKDFMTNGGDSMTSFDYTFADTSAKGYAYVVLWTNSAEDGSVSEATVRLVRF